MSLGDCLPDTFLTRQPRAGTMKSFSKAEEGQNENRPVVADWILTPRESPCLLAPES